ncbi:MAG: substrate-binding domain-containing protein [Ilumatobacteraceae bacterium]
MTGPLSRRSMLGGVAALGAGVALSACSTKGGKKLESPSTTVGAAAGTGVTTTATTGNGADYSALKGKTVGVVGITLDSAAVARGVSELQRIATENGIDLQVVNTSGDYQKVNDTLKAWASQGIAAAVLPATTSDNVTDGSAAMAAAKIPLAGFFSGTAGDVTFDVTSNEWISGQIIATYVRQRLDATNPGKGVALFNFSPLEATHVREVCMQSQLDFYKIPQTFRHEVKVPGQVPDVQQTVTDLLTKYPKGSELGAIWCGWDEIGLAAATAVETAGRDDLFVVSIDGNEGNLDNIRKGGVFAATVVNDMPSVAGVALAQLAGIVAGGPPPVTTTFFVDAPLVTKYNVPTSGIPGGTGLDLYFTT